MILFDTVPADRVVLALRGADVDIRDFILAALSSRMRRMVESELATGASPPRREIMDARRQIAETVLKLAEQGKIDLTSPAEAESESA
jgi:flagellar motor switch protein FliG